MYLTEQQLKDNFKNFPTHLWIHPKFDGIEFVEKKVIRLDEIIVDDERAQIRKRNNLGSRQQKLERSFKLEDVDYNQQLPVVSVDNEGKYSLEGGFTRDALFSKTGQTHWIFNVVKVNNKKQLNQFRVWLNKGTYAETNSEEDMIYMGTKAVQNNEVKISGIRKWLIQADSSWDEKSLDIMEKAIRKAVKSKSKPSRFSSYTDKTINRQWIIPKWSPEHRESIGFHFNKTVNGFYGDYMLGHRGGVRDGLSQAVDRHIKSGRKVKTLFLVNNSRSTVNSGPTLLKSRKNVFKEFEAQKSRWDNFYGNVANWEDVYEVIGFVPIDTTNECQGQPVNPESYKV